MFPSHDRNQIADGRLPKGSRAVHDDFKKAIDEEANAALSNPYDMLSVYTNSMGQKRQFTFNGDDQVDGTVLLDKDPAGGLPRPNFETEIGSKQKQEVIDNFKNRVKVRLDQSVTQTGAQIKVPSKSLSEAQALKLKGKQDNALEFIRHAWELYTSPVDSPASPLDRDWVL